MTQPEPTPLQQVILDTVHRHPGQFSRSGLAKLLVGARSWEDTNYPEYGRLAGYRRKDVAYQVDVLCQQGFLGLDSRERLIPASSDGE